MKWLKKYFWHPKWGTAFVGFTLICLGGMFLSTFGITLGFWLVCLGAVGLVFVHIKLITEKDNGQLPAGKKPVRVPSLKEQEANAGLWFMIVLLMVPIGIVLASMSI